MTLAAGLFFITPTLENRMVPQDFPRGGICRQGEGREAMPSG